MFTVPDPDRAEGDLRIWATYPDRARAERVRRGLERIGLDAPHRSRA